MYMRRTQALAAAEDHEATLGDRFGAATIANDDAPPAP